MIEKIRKCLERGGEDPALLTDPSKAFDCLPHDLLIAKLHAYGFDTSSMKLIHNYLKNRYRGVIINSVFNLIKYGVPQGSTISPILFSNFLCDLILIIKGIDIASYAHGNTPNCLVLF